MLMLVHTCWSMHEHTFAMHEHTFAIHEPLWNHPLPFNLVAPGNGDKYKSGEHIHYPPVVIRANTSEEACPDLRWVCINTIQ